ncbi:spermidine synthase [Roseibium sp. CAU 1637]|uniref:Spermidine synthase n=1 Tax=Roseibium limicola TaxID=2816037 RepID=A0A939J6L9_9HYPH|nr:spermidine synthase [Roseibium limicola]
MSLFFEELDYRPTPIGALSLRRRRDPVSNEDYYEIILGDAYLMSSRFTVAEEELSTLGLAAVSGEGLDVVVGGLGLGYTARSALKDERIASLMVLDALEPVIDWHKEGLLPVGRDLTADGRCRFQLGDFFTLAASDEGLDPQAPGRKFHAILVDIDHSPSNVLDPKNAAFYQPDGLMKLASHLQPKGVFALWSNDPPADDFEAAMAQVFPHTESHIIPFSSPLNDVEETNTIYVGRL